MVIPNSHERSEEIQRKVYDIIHVGRYSSQKRSDLVYSIIKNYNSVAVTDLEIISNPNIKFFNNILNEKVLLLMKQSKYFVLLSKYEGSPKALIESIQSGCIPVLSEEVRNILPLNFKKYFLVPRICDGNIANLDEIAKKYLLGKTNLQYYFDRSRCVDLWRKYICKTVIS